MQRIKKHILNFKVRFTRIPHVLIDNVLCKVSFPAYEIRLLLLLMRMSWGWSKKNCITTTADLAERTRISKPNINRTLKALEKKFIIVSHIAGEDRRIEINLDYMSWRIPESQTLFTEQVTPADIARMKFEAFGNEDESENEANVVCTDYDTESTETTEHSPQGLSDTEQTPVNTGLIHSLKKGFKELLKKGV